MKRRSVRSSSIQSVGYDPAGHVLEVEFRNGNVYRYFNVPPLTYDEFVHAHSLGRYLNLLIKEHFPYRRE